MLIIYIHLYLIYLCMTKITKNRLRFRFLLIILNSDIIIDPHPNSLTLWSLCNNKAMAKGSLLPALQSLSYCPKTWPGSESSALQRMWQISALRYWHKFHIIPLYTFHCMLLRLHVSSNVIVFKSNVNIWNMYERFQV